MIYWKLSQIQLPKALGTSLSGTGPNLMTSILLRPQFLSSILNPVARFYSHGHGVSHDMICQMQSKACCILNRKGCVQMSFAVALYLNAKVCFSALLSPVTNICLCPQEQSLRKRSQERGYRRVPPQRGTSWRGPRNGRMALQNVVEQVHASHKPIK